MLAYAQSIDVDGETLLFREEVREEDSERVRRIVESTGFFSREEVGIALELVRETLDMGVKSGYHFVFAELRGEVVGYTCYGRIPGTATSFDLYWIAVDQAFRGRKIGKMLIAKTEELVSAMGGVRLYIETSAREQYRSTHDFYMKCGYSVEAVLRDFYAPGDDKIIYAKTVSMRRSA